MLSVFLQLQAKYIEILDFLNRSFKNWNLNAPLISQRAVAYAVDSQWPSLFLYTYFNLNM